MKAKHLIITIISLLCMSLSAQISKPLVIEGQITNSAEPRLLIIIEEVLENRLNEEMDKE